MNRYHSTLPKSLERYRSRIADYSDERAMDSPIFVSYVSGWKSYTDVLGAQHCDAVDNVKDALYHVRNVIKCDCVECVRDAEASK